MIFRWLRNRRRRRILDEPFPREWLAVLNRNVGHYPRLTLDEQARLRTITQVIVAEKHWEGANRFPISDDVKVTIAAQAALLLLGMDHDYYSRVPTVIVYPGAYEIPDRDEFGDIDDTFPAHVVDGTAEYRGPVTLNWQEVLHEGRDPSRGGNVVVHEFAHQLDFLDGVVNGTPPLDDPAIEARWGHVMTAAFERHLDDLKHRRPTFFTEHAGDNETEYFADATEAFYCVPNDLIDEEPEVFELLQAYYRVDPRKWF